MKSVLIPIVVLFSFENILSKSFLLHEKDFLNAEEEVDERSRPKTESEGKVIWKRTEMNPFEESIIDTEQNSSGTNFFMLQPTSQQMVNEDMTGNAIATENEITLEKQSFSNNSLAKIPDDQNTIANDTSLDQLSTSLSVELELHNLTNAMIIDFSNITGDAIILDTFSENSEDDLDEVSEMSKGEEIAVLHEMPTSSFEFLIDAQTRKNILLKELLGPQTIFFEENDTEPEILREIERTLTATDLRSHGNNSEELTLNDSFAPVSDKSEDEMAKEDNIDEITAASSEIQLKNNSENIAPECPQPGWCIFWFLSQDTCAVNSHCLGSRICCTIGCSKTCVDI